MRLFDSEEKREKEKTDVYGKSHPRNSGAKKPRICLSAIFSYSLSRCFYSSFPLVAQWCYTHTNDCHINKNRYTNMS